MKYILDDTESSGCIFCDLAKQNDSVDNLIIARGKLAYVVANRFPYTSGHVMIIPFQHQSSLEMLSPAERAEMMELSTQAIQVIQKLYHPQGFNVGFNLGAGAGAGIAEHLHMHVVPRWNGDSNFMTAIGMTRVIPERLKDTHARLLAGWQRQFPD